MCTKKPNQPNQSLSTANFGIAWEHTYNTLEYTEVYIKGSLDSVCPYLRFLRMPSLMSGMGWLSVELKLQDYMFEAMYEYKSFV